MSQIEVDLVQSTGAPEEWLTACCVPSKVVQGAKATPGKRRAPACQQGEVGIS